MSKAGWMSFYSALSKGVSVLVGPFTIYLVSKKLSTEEIGFYYTFFNLIAMQQLAEIGIGHTIKQYIAHSMKFSQSGFLTRYSIYKMKSYLIFARKWFFIISMFIFFIIGGIGFYYYDSPQSVVEWRNPWVLFIASSAFFVNFLPFQFFAEATQNQQLLFKSQLISNIISAVALWFSLLGGIGLYGIAINVILNGFILNLILYFGMRKNHHILKSSKYKPFKFVFFEIWPLLSKVSIVWFFGFLFWNGFNLISFKVLTANDAGKVIFTLSLVRTMFNVAESFVSSQMTLYSNFISNGHFNKAKNLFDKYQILSFVFLMLGFLGYSFLKFSFPDFTVFKKTIDLNVTFQMFLFFSLLMVLTTRNNFVRCFKIEPFMLVSIFHGLFVPISFYFLLKVGSSQAFLAPCLVLMVSLIWSYTISRPYFRGLT